MAEAENRSKDEAEPARGRPKTTVVMVAAAAVCLLGLGGGAYLAGFGGSDGAEAAKAPGIHGQNASADGADPVDGEAAVLPLDTFVVNLADVDAQRYLKATMKVEFFGNQPPLRFTTRRAQIRDLLITLLSSKSVSEVRTVEGKQQLRDEVIARLNRVLEQDVVKAVYFVEFIVQ